MPVQDVSRTQLQALLSDDASALLDALMSFIPMGLTIAEPPDVRIVRVSDAGAVLLGRPRNAVEAITVEKHSEAHAVYDPLTGELAAPERLPLTRATLKGEMVRNEEWLLRAGSGTEITLLCNAGPVRNAVGEVIGGIIAWADITHQKQLERDLLDAVTERDRLLSELHHRIGNHLQLVGAMLRMEARQSPDAATLVEKIEQRLLALARSYSALRRTIEDIPAAVFLSEVCEPLQTSHVRIELQAEAAVKLPTAAAPTVGIVVNEAVCNSLKHAFPGEREGTVRVSLTQEHNHLLLRITDDGVGIKPSASSDGQGQGLMSHLMKSLRGRIEISSAPDAGTTVTAYWPIH